MCVCLLGCVCVCARVCACVNIGVLRLNLHCIGRNSDV